VGKASMRLAVVGAGSWGSALAIHAARAGCAVRLWAREPEIVEGIATARRNPLFLPEAAFPAAVEATGDLSRACEDADAILIVVPVQFARGVLRALRSRRRAGVPVVSASKGIEVGTLARMDEIVGQELGLEPEGFVALSGPTFSREVAAGLPTAAVLAGRDGELVQRLQRRLSTPSFRFYATSDVVGVELAGALKNVIAIAAGMASGMGLGHNTAAAVLTRGLHEITRLGVRLGGREETFRGLAGMGDLVLTCTGELSRNRTVGERLGRGEPLAAVTAGREVAEGVPTAGAAATLARRHGVDMPVAFTVEAILAGRMGVREAVASLMTRELKDEAAL
jgi:glycerol-3-phosphate dehydrogenase (NAD(P)+)